MKEEREVDYGSRKNQLGREQQVLKKTMTGEELASVMALLDSRPGVIMKVDTDLSEAVGTVISLTSPPRYTITESPPAASNADGSMFLTLSTSFNISTSFFGVRLFPVVPGLR